MHLLRLVTALLFFSTTAFADFNLAGSFYQAGKFKEAYDEYLLLATNGDHDAQFNLGVMYLKGQFVTSDRISAYGWIALAAQDGNQQHLTIKQALLDEFTAEQKTAATAKEADMLAEFSDKVISQKMTPHFNASVYQGPRATNKTDPVYPYGTSMDGIGGFVELTYSIDEQGIPHDYGLVTTPNAALAEASVNALRRWRFEPARHDGRPVATYQEGLRINFIITTAEASFKKQVKKILKKAEQNAASEAPADLYKLAYISDVIGHSYGVEVDQKKIGETFWKSAEKGYAPAQFQLGKRVLVGNACSANAVAAQSWLLRAALANQPDAQYLLGAEMLSGARLVKNESAGLMWLERAANANYPFARVKLAWIYATHPDADKRNGKHAQNLLQKVSDEYLDRGHWYETNAAVAAELGDFKQAIEWQKKALDDAKEFELPLQPVQARLDAYTQHKSWTEAM